MTNSKAASRHRATTRRAARPKGQGGKRPAATRQPNQKLPLSYSPTDEDITPEVMEFIEAINLYKREHNRPFPTWSEVLKILTGMGYRRG